MMNNLIPPSHVGLGIILFSSIGAYKVLAQGVTNMYVA